MSGYVFYGDKKTDDHEKCDMVRPCARSVIWYNPRARSVVWSGPMQGMCYDMAPCKECVMIWLGVWYIRAPCKECDIVGLHAKSVVW